MLHTIQYALCLSICGVISFALYGSDFPNAFLLHKLRQYQERMLTAKNMNHELMVTDGEDIVVTPPQKYISWTATKQGSEYAEKYPHQVKSMLSHTTRLPEVLLAMVVDYVGMAWKFEIYQIHETPVMQISYMDQEYASSISSREFLQEASDQYRMGVRWNIVTGKRVSNEYGFVQGKVVPSGLREGRDGVIDYALSLDQSKMAACRVLRIEVWEAKKFGSQEYTVFKPPTVGTYGAPFSAVAFSPCGDYLCIGALNGVVTIMNLVLKVPVYTLYHSQSVTALACSPFGNEILVGLSTGSIVVWTGGPFSSFYRHEARSQEVVPSAPTPIALPSTQPGKRSLFRSFCATMLSWRSKS